MKKLSFIAIVSVLMGAMASSAVAQDQTSTLDMASDPGGLTFQITLSEKPKTCNHKITCAAYDSGSGTAENDTATMNFGISKKTVTTYRINNLPSASTTAVAALDGSTNDQLPALYCSATSKCTFKTDSGNTKATIYSNVKAVFYVCGKGKESPDDAGKGKGKKEKSLSKILKNEMRKAAKKKKRKAKKKNKKKKNK